LEKQELAAVAEVARQEKEKTDTVHRAVADEKRDQRSGIYKRLQVLKKELECIASSPNDANQLDRGVKNVQVLAYIVYHIFTKLGYLGSSE